MASASLKHTQHAELCRTPTCQDPAKHGVLAIQVRCRGEQDVELRASPTTSCSPLAKQQVQRYRTGHVLVHTLRLSLHAVQHCSSGRSFMTRNCMHMLVTGLTWLLLVLGPAFAMATMPLSSCLALKFSSCELWQNVALVYWFTTCMPTNSFWSWS
jgi:hypothetical protein